MKHGPVLSRVYDLVSQKKQELPESEWHQFIPRPSQYVYTVQFGGVSDVSSLSEAELTLIDRVFAEHQSEDEWDLVAFTHQLPEWHDPIGSSAPISFEEILRAGGASDEDIEAIAENVAADRLMDAAMSRAR
jgi:hypothetical protein